MTLFVSPECVWVEKGFAAGGTHQPHSQVHLAHMCTDGGSWGWWTLFEALNLAPIHLLSVPQLNVKGLHVGRVCLLWSWKDSWKGRLHCLVCRIGNFRSCGLLKGQMGDSGRWDMMSFLVGRWGWRYRGGWHFPPSETHKNLPLSLPLLLPFSQPLSLQVLGLSFQPVGLLPQGTSPFQQVQPLKDKRKQIQGYEYIGGTESHMDSRQRKQTERKPTSSNSLHASSSGWAGKSPTCIQLWSVSMSSYSFLRGLEPSSSADSSAKKKKTRLKGSNDMLKKCTYMN